MENEYKGVYGEQIFSAIDKFVYNNSSSNEKAMFKSISDLKDPNPNEARLPKSDAYFNINKMLGALAKSITKTKKKSWLLTQIKNSNIDIQDSIVNSYTEHVNGFLKNMTENPADFLDY